jgi:segregation and condensation protein A
MSIPRPTARARVSDYRVNLDVFAGPLDLLLYLVRKEEVDIYDIPISRITEQYVQYIELLQEMDMDLAGDFLVMAATLMEIKSAMLLPQAPGETEETAAVGGDPRSELIRQLLEYKRFKDAANLLSSAAEQQSQRFHRPDTIVARLQPDREPEIDMDQVDVWALLEAFDAILKATGGKVFSDHIKDDTPIDLYQIEMLDRLQTEGPMPFERLFQGKGNRLILVGMFLALLELVRNKLITAEQHELHSPIYLRSLTQETAAEAVRKAILATTEEVAEVEAAKEANAARQEEPVAQESAEGEEQEEDEQIDDEPEALKYEGQEHEGTIDTDAKPD